jgi:hypothetical protein
MSELDIKGPDFLRPSHPNLEHEEGRWFAFFRSKMLDWPPLSKNTVVAYFPGRAIALFSGPIAMLRFVREIMSPGSAGRVHPSRPDCTD